MRDTTGVFHITEQYPADPAPGIAQIDLDLSPDSQRSLTAPSPSSLEVATPPAPTAAAR